MVFLNYLGVPAEKAVGLSVPIFYSEKNLKKVFLCNP